MNKELEKELKLEEITKAKECFEEAYRLIEKGEALISRNVDGISFCSHMNSRDVVGPYKGMINVHFHKGISKIAEILDMELTPKEDFDGSIDNDYSIMAINGMKFFEIGDE